MYYTLILHVDIKSMNHVSLLHTLSLSVQLCVPTSQWSILCGPRAHVWTDRHSSGDPESSRTGHLSLSQVHCSNTMAEGTGPPEGTCEFFHLQRKSFNPLHFMLSFSTSLHLSLSLSLWPRFQASPVSCAF